MTEPEKTAPVVNNGDLQKPKRPSPNPNGRPKGSKNKTTTALKEAILLAADRVGGDGKGKDGLVGYLVKVATDDLKAFAGLLGKVLPLQLTGANDGTIKVEIVRHGDDPNTE